MVRLRQEKEELEVQIARVGAAKDAEDGRQRELEEEGQQLMSK